MRRQRAPRAGLRTAGLGRAADFGRAAGSSRESLKRRSKAGSGASKSAAIWTRPFQAPSRRSSRSGGQGTRRTQGLPDFEKMISSPPSASSTHRDRCVFASCMLIRFMRSSLVWSDCQRHPVRATGDALPLELRVAGRRAEAQPCLASTVPPPASGPPSSPPRSPAAPGCRPSTGQSSRPAPTAKTHGRPFFRTKRMNESLEAASNFRLTQDHTSRGRTRTRTSRHKPCPQPKAGTPERGT